MCTAKEVTLKHARDCRWCGKPISAGAATLVVCKTLGKTVAQKKFAYFGYAHTECGGELFKEVWENFPH